MKEKRAKDIMTTEVIVANKNDIIANVANLLIKEKIGGLPVVDEENKVVGIISETDIMKKESHIDSPKMLNFLQGIIFLNDMKKFEDELRVIAAYKVEDLMSKDIVTVKEDDTFDYVANIMINESINRVPVVDKENRLVGIITVDDILDVIEEETTEDIEKMAAIVPTEKPYLKLNIWDIFKRTRTIDSSSFLFISLTPY